MTADPKLEHRNEQPYAAIRAHVPIPFGERLGPMWGEVTAWLGRQGQTPSGPPFIRYLTTDMASGLDIEVGFPAAAVLPGDSRVSTGVLPAGRYAVLAYYGHYDNLMSVTTGMLAWAEKNQVAWRTAMVDNQEWWSARLEWYPTDPVLEPDPQKWQTELAFLTA